MKLLYWGFDRRDFTLTEISVGKEGILITRCVNVNFHKMEKMHEAVSKVHLNPAGRVSQLYYHNFSEFTDSCQVIFGLGSGADE